METGLVKWFDRQKGFGFIERPGQGDVFVHYHVIEGEGFRKLNDHEPVEYELTETDTGLCATKVRRLAKPATEARAADADRCGWGGMAGGASGGRAATRIGQVKWFDRLKGFGFIAVPGGPDVFVHHRDIEARGFRTLDDGDTVEYEPVDGEKGARATKVRRLPRPHGRN